MPDKNPYRTLHARMSPPGAAWDEGFAAGRAAATPDPPDHKPAIGLLRAAAVQREIAANHNHPVEMTVLMASWEGLRLAADLLEREAGMVHRCDPVPASPDPPPCRCPDDWRYDDGSVFCPRHQTKPDAPAASPDPPDDWTAAILTLRRAMCTPAGREQVERELIRPFAASPDERLREAVAALPQYVITIQDREGYTYERGCEGQPVNYTGVMLADVEALVGELKDHAPAAHETTDELKDSEIPTNRGRRRE